MISRERVLTALRHQTPDRTPRDFWAEAPAWNRLLAHTGQPDRDALLDALDIDIRHLDAEAPTEREIRPGIFQNFWGERFIHQPTPWGPMREDLKGALATAANLAELEAFDWPSPDCLDRSGLPAQCARHADRALIYGFADVWQRPALVRGWEEMFLDMAEHTDWVRFLCRKFTDFYLEDYTRAAEITRGRIDLYLVISDLGSQRGPLISVRMFRELIAPFIGELVARIHQLGGLAMFHSCGMIRPFIPDLIELGVDVLDPIQPVHDSMQPESLKQDFAGRLAFHGGIDMQRLLPSASTEEVRAEVRRYCATLGEGGGYVLSPAHLFQPDVPPENVLAMYDGAP